MSRGKRLVGQAEWKGYSMEFESMEAAAENFAKSLSVFHGKAVVSIEGDRLAVHYNVGDGRVIKMCAVKPRIKGCPGNDAAQA